MRTQAQLQGRHGARVFRTLWIYDTRDPWAVHLMVQDLHGPVRWCFARDLLRDGLLDGDGEGDVVIKPVKEGVDITLRSDKGQITILFSSDELIEFLEESERLVPWGKETEWTDIDAELRSIIERSEA